MQNNIVDLKDRKKKIKEVNPAYDMIDTLKQGIDIGYVKEIIILVKNEDGEVGIMGSGIPKSEVLEMLDKIKRNKDKMGEVIY